MSASNNITTPLLPLAELLLVAGGLNTGIVALTDGAMNPLEQLTGGNDMLRKAVNGAVGASAAIVLLNKVFGGPPAFRQLK